MAGDGGSDRYMAMNEVRDSMLSLEKRYSVDIENAADAESKDRLTKLQSKERYKAMRQLDRQNERASPN